MPEEPEVETTDLQDAIDEIHQDRAEREAEEARSKWTRYVGLATAIFAVFAALGALQSGSLVNEAMIEQLKSSDAWNEYQADKEKAHQYVLQVNAMIDAGTAPEPVGHKSNTGKIKAGVRMSPGQRLAEYLDEIDKENAKTTDLNKKATDLANESKDLLEHHHRFAFSVTGIQVAIALGAVAALTKMKWIWFVSLVFGLFGVVLFIQGWL
jgi:nitrate reductase NapE component